MVDSQDRERIGLARQELAAMLAREEMKDVALLVYANKQDDPSMTVAFIGEQLRLQAYPRLRWYVQASCALTGDGLYEGLDWLTDALSKKIPSF